MKYYERSGPATETPSEPWMYGLSNFTEWLHFPGEHDTLSPYNKPYSRLQWGPPSAEIMPDGTWWISYRCPKCKTVWDERVALTETSAELFCHKDGTRLRVPLPLPTH